MRSLSSFSVTAKAVWWHGVDRQASLLGPWLSSTRHRTPSCPRHSSQSDPCLRPLDHTAAASLKPCTCVTCLPHGGETSAPTPRAGCEGWRNLLLLTAIAFRLFLLQAVGHFQAWDLSHRGMTSIVVRCGSSDGHRIILVTPSLWILRTR